MSSILNAINPYLGLAAFSATAYFLLYAIYESGSRIVQNARARLDEHRLRKKVIGWLQYSLSSEEKPILRDYVDNDTKTHYFQITDGAHIGLAAKGILYRASNAATFVSGVAYNIQDIAFEYLKENRHLLD